MKINKEVINLNNDDAFMVGKLPIGKSKSIIKVGRTLFKVDADKDVFSTCMSIYPAKNKSKYGEDHTYISGIKNDALLTKRFFEEKEDIAKAQFVLHHVEHLIAKR